MPLVESRTLFGKTYGVSLTKYLPASIVDTIDPNFCYADLIATPGTIPDVPTNIIVSTNSDKTLTSFHLTPRTSGNLGPDSGEFRTENERCYFPIVDLGKSFYFFFYDIGNTTQARDVNNLDDRVTTLEGGGVVPAGSPGDVQFNDTLALAANGDLNWDDSGKILLVNGQLKQTDGSESIGRVLTSDATGLSTWADTVMTPAGSADGQIQFRDSAGTAFNAEANLFWDSGANRLEVEGTISLAPSPDRWDITATASDLTIVKDGVSNTLTLNQSGDLTVRGSIALDGGTGTKCTIKDATSFVTPAANTVNMYSEGGIMKYRNPGADDLWFVTYNETDNIVEIPNNGQLKIRSSSDPGGLTNGAIDSQDTQTNTTGTNKSHLLSSSINPGAAGPGSYNCVSISASVQGGVSNPITNVRGLDLITQMNGSSTCTNLYGADIFAQTTGSATVSNAFGARISLRNLNASATITNGTGLSIVSPTVTGSITNMYGVRISDLSGAGTSYAFRQDGTTDINLYAGINQFTQYLQITDQSAPGTPSGSGRVYVESGALKYIGSSGTITEIAVS